MSKQILNTSEKTRMKIISFNVNGVRAVLQKNKKGIRGTQDPNVLEVLIADRDPDIIALQETKCPDNIKINLGNNYHFQKIISSKTRKGYSGVAVFSKHHPIKDWTDTFPENQEGRLICLEYDGFLFINIYVPNSKPDLSRLDYRVNKWEKIMRDYIEYLTSIIKKPMIVVADFNVAPTEIDLHNPKANVRSHGFTIEERSAFQDLLKSCKLIDAYRFQHPHEIKYTWFSHFANSRTRNVGWRIDMALVSLSLSQYVKQTDILSDYFGSDHVPIFLELKI